MDAEDPFDDLVEAACDLIESTFPAIEAACCMSGDPHAQSLPISFYAAARRQHDALVAILILVKNDRGEAAVPLLRPACEELFWLQYLAQIPEHHAHRLVIVTAMTELHRSLIAQKAFSSDEVMDYFGFTPVLKARERDADKVRSELKHLGKELGWPDRTVREGDRPSVYWIAKQTDNVGTYNFLYSATSRYVHFSPYELMRRAHGVGTQIYINANLLRRYWSSFALVWAMRLFFNTLKVCHERFSPFPIEKFDPDAIGPKVQRFSEFGVMPLLTPMELSVPERN